MNARRSPVLVTGAAGNLGSRLVPRLERAGREVRPVDVRPSAHPGAIVAYALESYDFSWLEDFAKVSSEYVSGAFFGPTPRVATAPAATLEMSH